MRPPDPPMPPLWPYALGGAGLLLLALLNEAISNPIRPISLVLGVVPLTVASAVVAGLASERWLWGRALPYLAGAGWLWYSGWAETSLLPPLLFFSIFLLTVAALRLGRRIEEGTV